MRGLCVAVLAIGCASAPAPAPKPSVAAAPPVSAPAPARNGADDKAALFDKFETFRDEMCMCVAGDDQCAEGVQKEMEAYANDHKGHAEPVLNAAEKQRAEDIAVELAGCMARALNPPSP